MIKLPIVLSIFEWLFYAGFTVHVILFAPFTTKAISFFHLMMYMYFGRQTLFQNNKNPDKCSYCFLPPQKYRSLECF